LLGITSPTGPRRPQAGISQTQLSGAALARAMKSRGSARSRRAPSPSRFRLMRSTATKVLENKTKYILATYIRRRPGAVRQTRYTASRRGFRSCGFIGPRNEKTGILASERRPKTVTEISESASSPMIGRLPLIGGESNYTRIPIRRLEYLGHPQARAPVSTF
jgi:hypothetical protein